MISYIFWECCYQVWIKSTQFYRHWCLCRRRGKVAFWICSMNSLSQFSLRICASLTAVSLTLLLSLPSEPRIICFCDPDSWGISSVRYLLLWFIVFLLPILVHFRVHLFHSWGLFCSSLFLRLVSFLVILRGCLWHPLDFRWSFWFWRFWLSLLQTDCVFDLSHFCRLSTYAIV